MADFSLQAWTSKLSNADPLAFLIAVLLIISIPLFLHLVLYRSSSSTSLPTFLLFGPSGAGKTALLTLLERGQHADTRISHSPLTVECSLPTGSTAASSRFRSTNDPSNEIHKKFFLVDTPGHGKLRQHAIDSIVRPVNIVGLIFVVDAADLSTASTNASGNEQLRHTAEYLYEVLLLLQKRATSSKRSGPSTMPLLIAANKQDLFTALPASMLKSTLEAELTKIRNSKSKGLLDSGVGLNDADEDRELLGGEGDRFEFAHMEEANVIVQVLGGNVIGSQGSDVKAWSDWIGNNI